MGTQVANAALNITHYLATAATAERASACGLWKCSFPEEVELSLNQSCKLVQFKIIEKDILPPGESREWGSDVPFAVRKVCNVGFKVRLAEHGVLPPEGVDRVDWMDRHVEYVSKCKDPTAERPHYLSVAKRLMSL